MRAGPLSGLRRAKNHAVDFAFRYLIASVPWTIIVFVVVSIWETTEMAVGVGIVFLLINFCGLFAMMPAAFVANFVAVRALRSRSWRREPWRAKVAGYLGVPLVWGGTLVWLGIQDRPPKMMGLFGNAAPLVYGLGIVVLFSNLAVLIGWMIPSEKAVR